jgi:hypothetical protein
MGLTVVTDVVIDKHGQLDHHAIPRLDVRRREEHDIDEEGPLQQREQRPLVRVVYIP